MNNNKSKDVKLMRDIKFMAGMLWGVIFVLGGWCWAMIAEPMNNHPVFLLMIVPLLIWGMTWTSSLKTRGWCLKCMIKLREHQRRGL